MRIDVVMLISGLDAKMLQHRQESLSSYASPGTEVRLVTTRNAPASVESQTEMELAAPGILERVAQSEREGDDAVVIWGGHDPSLIAARELVSVPVVGPGMASMHVASMLAKRFSLLVQLPHVIDIARRQIRNLELEGRCAGIYPVGIHVLDLGKPESFTQVMETAVISIEEGGADAICLGCMAMNDHADHLAKRLKESHPAVVVVHPGKTAIRMAELIVGMELSHSKRSYPYPPKKVDFKL